MEKKKNHCCGFRLCGLIFSCAASPSTIRLVVLDVDSARVDQINTKQSTVADTEIEAFLEEKELDITATLDRRSAYQGASFVVVATPTNYDTDQFDTSSVDEVVEDALG